MNKLYYTAPSDEIFEEVKEKAIKIWTMIGDHPNYIEEKVERIKSLENIRDNFMTIFAMFDEGNQKLLSGLLSEEARIEIKDRLISGGVSEDDAKYITNLN